MTVLGVGNVLQKDDGFGVYAAMYLESNYRFDPQVEIVNGGVEGIHLYNVIERSDAILLLDAVAIDDEPGSIYLIPAEELESRGLNCGGAHEIGVLQVLDMMELQGKTIPPTTLLGIVPQHVTFAIDLSKTLMRAFDDYIRVALRFLQRHGITATPKSQHTPLRDVIDSVRRL